MKIFELQAVREKIAQGWTQQAYGRTVDGMSMSYGGRSDAVCWCLSGSIEAVRGIDGQWHGGLNPYPLSEGASDELADALGFSCYIEMEGWNDAPGRTQAEVLARIDDAIAARSALEKEG